MNSKNNRSYTKENYKRNGTKTHIPDIHIIPIVIDRQIKSIEKPGQAYYRQRPKIDIKW